MATRKYYRDKEQCDHRCVITHILTGYTLSSTCNGCGITIHADIREHDKDEIHDDWISRANQSFLSLGKGFAGLEDD